MSTPAHKSSSVIRMLAFDCTPGPGGVAHFWCDTSFGRSRCDGCGYLRFSVLRQWSSGKLALITDDWEKAKDQIVGTIEGGELAWSQRVVDAVRSGGFTGATFHRVPVVSRKNGEEFSSLQPYYWIEITGRVTVDRQLYDGGDGFLCPECGVWKPRLEGTVRWGDKVTAIVDEGAGMPDFVFAANIAGLHPFMSIRAAQFFGASGFTGFMYLPLIPNYPSSGGDVGNPGADGWWEAYIEKVRANMPPGCML